MSLNDAILAALEAGGRQVGADARKGTLGVTVEDVALDVSTREDEKRAWLHLSTAVQAPVVGTWRDAGAALSIDAAPTDLAEALVTGDVRALLHRAAPCEVELVNGWLTVTVTFAVGASGKLQERVDCALHLAARLAKRAPKIDVEVDAKLAAAGGGDAFRGSAGAGGAKQREAQRQAEREAWLKRKRRSETGCFLVVLALIVGLVVWLAKRC